MTFGICACRWIMVRRRIIQIKHCVMRNQNYLSVHCLFLHSPRVDHSVVKMLFGMWEIFRLTQCHALSRKVKLILNSMCTFETSKVNSKNFDYSSYFSLPSRKKKVLLSRLHNSIFPLDFLAKKLYPVYKINTYFLFDLSYVDRY